MKFNIMWKKIIGGFMIGSATLFILVGFSNTFNKTPYCEWLAKQYDNPYHDYSYEYVQQFKIPSGACYNHFTSLKLITNLIVLGYGVHLVNKDKGILG